MIRRNSNGSKIGGQKRCRVEQKECRRVGKREGGSIVNKEDEEKRMRKKVRAVLKRFVIIMKEPGRRSN